jgi:hypothetical protein
MIDELAQAKFKVLYVLVFTAVEEELWAKEVSAKIHKCKLLVF